MLYLAGRLLETEKPVYLYDVEIQINRFFYFNDKNEFQIISKIVDGVNYLSDCCWQCRLWKGYKVKGCYFPL